MRVLIQEALNAKVEVDGNPTGAIEKGAVLLVGFKNGDDFKVVNKMVDKLWNLRIFPDENANTNLTLAQVDGNLLVVSQFTLYADLTQGNRPSFHQTMTKEQAQPLFAYFSTKIKELLPQAQFGIFHAQMRVTLTNVGPFTILLDSDELGFADRE